MKQLTIGVIGGSGLYEIEGLEDIEEVRLETLLVSRAMPSSPGCLVMSKWSSCLVMAVGIDCCLRKSPIVPISMV